MLQENGIIGTCQISDTSEEFGPRFGRGHAACDQRHKSNCHRFMILVSTFQNPGIVANNSFTNSLERWFEFVQRQANPGNANMGLMSPLTCRQRTVFKTRQKCNIRVDWSCRLSPIVNWCRTVCHPRLRAQAQCISSHSVNRRCWQHRCSRPDGHRQPVSILRGR